MGKIITQIFIYSFSDGLANRSDPSTFTFAICYSRSICLLSVTFVHPTSPVEIYRNFSMPFSTLAIH